MDGKRRKGILVALWTATDRSNTCRHRHLLRTDAGLAAGVGLHGYLGEAFSDPGSGQS